MNIKTLRRICMLYIPVHVLSHYAFLFMWEGSELTRILVSDIFSVIGPVIAAMFVWNAWKSIDERGRTFWWFTLLAISSYAIADLLWMYYDIVLRVPVPFPGLPDLFFLLQIVFLLLAVLDKMLEKRKTLKSVRMFFDLLVTMTVATTISWNYLIGPIFAKSEFSTLRIIASVAYPIVDLALLFGMAVLYMGKNMLPKKSLLLMTAGFWMLVIADSAFLYQNASGMYVSGSLFDPLFPFAMLVIGAASLYDTAKAETVEVNKQHLSEKTQSYLAFIPLFIPYVSIFLLLFLLLMRREQFDMILFGSVVSILLMLMRQIITLLENSTLLEQLHQLTEELEWKVKQRTEELWLKNRQLGEALRKMENMAFYDVLSGLPNRRLFQEQLETVLAQAQSTKKVVAVMFLDIDRFKFINDTLGHLLGDQLLIAVAKRLQESIPHTGTVSRQGGDEFTILLRDIADGSEVVAVTRRIQKSLSAPFHLDEHDLRISCSIGIALYPNDGSDVETLMKNADTAMYRVKETGKNGYQFYTSEMNTVVSRKMVLEKELHKAIDKGEFLLYYQPQINLESNQIIGIEALIRWKHPELGLIPPSEFISLAEETGLILPIGQWVIRTACQQLKQWHDSGLPKIRVGINISPRQFYQATLVEIISSVLTETQLEPKYIELEITENIAMQNVDVVIAKLNELKELGINISMDDFGTGYSSLSYLKKFPINTLKIAQQFVSDITTDENDEAIVSTIIAMANQLKLHVIAEGVETEAQLEYLKSQKCNEVQGYFFSKPLPVEEIEELLHKDK